MKSKQLQLFAELKIVMNGVGTKAWLFTVLQNSRLLGGILNDFWGKTIVTEQVPCSINSGLDNFHGLLLLFRPMPNLGMFY